MKLISSRQVRIALYCVLGLGCLVVIFALGVRVGINYKMNRLLFELPKQASLAASVKQAVGIQRTYAASMQDLWIVLSVASGKRDGYYVDLGAADGEIHSNTKLLDQMGWKGICIDPFATHMEKRTCQVVRQPVYSVSRKKVLFRAAGENGGIADTLQRNKEIASQSPLVEFETATMDEILQRMNAPKHIDYMNIDIEGAEFEALRGLSLDKYDVGAFTIEHNNENEKRQAIRQLLESRGYQLARSWLTDDWYVRRDLPYEFRLDWGFRK